MKTKNILLAIIGLLLVAVTQSLGSTLEAGGIAIAMAGGMFDTSSVHYRRLLLTKKMEKVVWNLSVWSQFMGIQTKGEDAYKYGSPKSFKPTGKPIEVIKDFQHQGRVNMDIPVFYPLTDQPTYGGKQLLGNEESRRWANKTISINQVRHGVKSQDNKYSRQTLKNPEFVKELMNENTAALTDYFTRWQAFQPGFAYVQGYSDNLVQSVADGGLGLTRKSHMNTYIAGVGRVTWSETHATYEANVNAGLDELENAAPHLMTSTVIENMVYSASHTHRIQPIKFKNGMSAYVIVISDAQAIQLAKDTTWIASQRSAFQQHGENHPQIQGKVAGYYAGAYIVIDETLPSAYVTGESAYSDARSTTGDNTGVCYGLSNYIATPVDPGARKPAILIGASSVACGVANEIGFETEDWDYKQQLTEAADMIVGYEIADIVDSDGKFTTAGNRYENVSSLICWTYSPSAVAWA